jgi:hypothetical protein
MLGAFTVFSRAFTPLGTASFLGKDICSRLFSPVVQERSCPIDPLRTSMAFSTTLEIKSMSSLQIDAGVPRGGSLRIGMGP